MSGWFPRPQGPGDLRCLGPSGELGREELFERLRSAEAREWRDKVGVISPADGSAKATTRLLCSGGWVFKTDTGAARSRMEDAQALLVPGLALAARLDLWHPDKRFFLLFADSDGLEGPRWWPVSACPRLTSLRAVLDWPRFARLWIQALSLGLELSGEAGVGLDLNPSNFGLEGRDGDGGDGGDGDGAQLRYLDDEVYPPLELTDFAEAMVGRIPEWPELDADSWGRFGELARAQLEPVMADARSWERVRDLVAEVLLAPAWEDARAALLAGIARGSPQKGRLSPAAKGGIAAPRKTAVIADVHGNLAALEVVIRAAEAAEVDSWLFLGDAVGYGPYPQECVRRLCELPNFAGVRGNHDHMACFGSSARVNRQAAAALLHSRTQLGPRERAWLMGLPIEQSGEGWLGVHGAPVDPQRFNAYVYAMSYRRNLEHLRDQGSRLCFIGHTHVPMLYLLAGDRAQAVPGRCGAVVDLSAEEVALVNPGSVGQPRDGDPRASFLIWERDAARVEFRRCAYALEETVRGISTMNLAEDLAEDLAMRLELGR